MAHSLTHYAALSVMLLAGSFVSHAQDNPPYVVLTDASGQLDVANRLQMTPVDNYYELKNVEIPNGALVFDGREAGSEVGTYYSLLSSAAPLVYGMPNPLVMSQGTPIKVNPGTYDIEFYNREDAESGYRQFILTPTDVAGPFYPSRLYLITSSKKIIEFEGTDGVYEMNGDIPDEPFKISYEPLTSEKAYVYGPVSAANTELQPGEETPIEWSKGVNALFSFDPAARETGRYSLEVSLVDNYVEVVDNTVTGIADITADNGTARYFNLQGVELTAEPTHGVYIKVNNGKAVKIAI